MSESADAPLPVIDAYCHVGLPRFSSAEDAWAILRNGDDPPVERAVFVLGPRIPDYETLFNAMQTYGDRVRGIGIPFGDTGEQVLESVVLQLRAGVLGLRVEPQALLEHPAILGLLGDWGRWCYAIGAVSSPKVARALLSWLERYPEARVAAPHFLKPGLLIAGEAPDMGLVRDLVSHPRFHPIFSRHGGVGSRDPYPHADLLPWVEQVIALAGWERILWGSEYPVLFWRNETMASCQDWLSALLGTMASEQRAAYLGGNAMRAIFETPAPFAETVEFPMWVKVLFAWELLRPDRPVQLFPGGLNIPMGLYQSLHHRFVAAAREDRALTFADFVTRMLEANLTTEDEV